MRSYMKDFFCILFVLFSSQIFAIEKIVPVSNLITEMTKNKRMDITLVSKDITFDEFLTFLKQCPSVEYDARNRVIDYGKEVPFYLQADVFERTGMLGSMKVKEEYLQERFELSSKTIKARLAEKPKYGYFKYYSVEYPGFKSVNGYESYLEEEKAKMIFMKAKAAQTEDKNNNLNEKTQENKQPEKKLEKENQVEKYNNFINEFRTIWGLKFHDSIDTVRSIYNEKSVSTDFKRDHDFCESTVVLTDKNFTYGGASVKGISVEFYKNQLYKIRIYYSSPAIAYEIATALKEKYSGQIPENILIDEHSLYAGPYSEDFLIIEDSGLKEKCENYKQGELQEIHNKEKKARIMEDL